MSLFDIVLVWLQKLELGLNPVTLAVICSILGVYIVLAIVCCCLDRSDLRRISLLPLCGRDGFFKYHVTVITGRQIGAGVLTFFSISVCICVCMNFLFIYVRYLGGFVCMQIFVLL